MQKLLIADDANPQYTAEDIQIARYIGRSEMFKEIIDFLEYRYYRSIVELLKNNFADLEGSDE
jgi:hypothetical protein